MHSSKYYIASPSPWPILGSFSLFLIMIGIVNLIHHHEYGLYLFFAGAIGLVYMMFRWFQNVIDESQHGLHNAQLDRSYRWGMVWFIFSEVAFFGIFFCALFYVRLVIVPQLGGNFSWPETHHFLWPEFKAIWPLLVNPNPALFPGPKEVIAAVGIPLLNTFILLSSAVAVTVAHWGLQKNRRGQLLGGLIVTILLGAVFLGIQAYEYHHAYTELGLTLASGIYGTTFFMLTGFHAAHVTVGMIMLITILIRCSKGHFNRQHQFGFEAVSWYWHFVDVVWLFLFIFVYWL